MKKYILAVFLLLVIAFGVGAAISPRDLDAMGKYLRQMGLKGLSTFYRPDNIKLIYPNGGEKFMLGDSLGRMIVPKWYPMGLGNIEAYLERKEGDKYVTIGRIGEIKKQPILNKTVEKPPYRGKTIEVLPGDNYYIRILEVSTNLTDRSDSAFSIFAEMPIGVNLKVNGSDGPITIKRKGENVTISWESKNADTCDFYPGPNEKPYIGDSLIGLPANGERVIFLKSKKSASSLKLLMYCHFYKPSGHSKSDSVDIIFSGPIIPGSSFLENVRNQIANISRNISNLFGK